MMTQSTTTQERTGPQEHIHNHYRFRRIRDGYLIVSEQGSWVYLDKDNFRKMQAGKAEGGLYETLVRKGILITQDNILELIEMQRKRFGFLYSGVSLHIIVPTLRCNQKCLYCHSSSRRMSEQGYDMKPETVIKTVEFILQCPNRTIKIEFQGGDSLANFGLFKSIVDEVKKQNAHHGKKIFFSIVTNLTMMKEEYLEWIQKEGINICTSLDGPKEVHDSSRVYESGKGTYDDVTGWIARMKKRGINVSALMVTTRKSLGKWKEIIDEYARLGMMMIQLKYLDRIGFAEDEWKQIGYTMDEFMDFWKKGVDYIIELNKKGIRMRERFVELILKKILTGSEPGFLDFRNPCGAVIGQLAYNYNGDIHSCDEGRGYGIFKAGNVFQDSYKQIFEKKDNQGIMSAAINETTLCDACIYKPYCGLCPVVTYAEQGNLIPKLATNFKCRLSKMQLDYVFEKILFDDEARKIFMSWMG